MTVDIQPASAGRAYAMRSGGFSAGVAGRVLGGVVGAGSVAQVLAIGIAGFLTFRGARASILQWRTPTGELTVWQAPASGVWGGILCIVEMLTILAGLMMATRGRAAVRHAGHVILLAWNVFWLQGTFRLALATGGEAWAVAGGSVLFLAAQVAWWAMGRRTSMPEMF